MPSNKIAYLELPASDVATLKTFYGSLFHWSFQDWGDDYVSFAEAGLDGGFNADASHKTRAPLPVLQTESIEEMEKAVQAAGGTVTRPVFAYPGGRRFHFTDPAGNELAVMQVD